METEKVIVPLTSRRLYSALLVVVCLCIVPADASAQKTSYGVTVDVPAAPALSKAATSACLPGQPAIDKSADQQILKAIDRELSTRIFGKIVFRAFGSTRED